MYGPWSRTTDFPSLTTATQPAKRIRASRRHRRRSPLVDRDLQRHDQQGAAKLAHRLPIRAAAHPLVEPDRVGLRLPLHASGAASPRAFAGVLEEEAPEALSDLT